MTSRHGVSLGRQVLRRKINERLLRATGDATVIEVFCECGGRMCASQVRVAVELYEGVVASGRRFLVAAGHENPPTKQAVGIYEQFVVVDRASATA